MTKPQNYGAKRSLIRMPLCTKCERSKDSTSFAQGQAWCRLCVKAYDADRFQRIRVERYAQVKVRKEAMLAWARDLKRDPCTDCGGTFHPVAMQWDHLDGSPKGDNVSQLVASGYGKNRILEEIAKCELVCANCHAVRTWRRRDKVLVDAPRAWNAEAEVQPLVSR